MATAAKLQHIWPTPGAGTSVRLLEWYDKDRRELPWRSDPGDRPDPYAVWLSEIMLQQTTVNAVVPFYLKFLRRWPTVTDLAAAPLDDVLTAWAGLGYYSRARNLHACAKQIVEQHGGAFPHSETELLELPGVGPYTAAAIASIAFGRHATPVDGNVERVVARLFAVDRPLPTAKPELKRLAATLTPRKRAGDHAQAMMDLGATICTPRRPSCLMCPISRDCAARAMGIEATLPARAPKPERPVRYGTAFVVLREDGHLLLRQRPESGLLARMMEVPTTEWMDAAAPRRQTTEQAPVRATWQKVTGLVSHTFTHFRLELDVFRAIVDARAEPDLWASPERCRWVARRNLGDVALPSLMRKVIAHALPQE